MTINGSGIRDIARVLKISTNTVMTHLKKGEKLSFVNISLLTKAKETEKMLVDIVKIKKAELGEMWSFVKKKSNQRWLQYAINHETGEILAYRFGKRKNSVFLKLKELLKSFEIEMNYTDNWISYSTYIDKNKHEIGKINTQKIERKNLNFRTRIKRLARKTICYSKTEKMYDIVIGLFINSFEF